MTNPLKESIKYRLKHERHQLKKSKPRQRRLNLQFLLVISVLLGLIATLFRVISLFIH